MTVSSQFAAAAVAPPQKRKNPPPVSVRLSWDEYDRLRDLAGTMSMAAFIRLRLFEDAETTPARKAYTRKRTKPSSELVMLGKMLGGLGESEIAASLSDIAEASKIGALPVASETDVEISDACRAVVEMRDALIAAMGVKSL